MRRNAIPFNTLLQLAEEFCAEKELNSKKKERGRPPLYPLSLILAMWLWKTMLKLSYRQTEVILHSLIPQDLPDFSTLHYRVSKITEDLWIEFLNWLARRSKNLEEVEVLLVDEARGDMVYPFTKE